MILVTHPLLLIPMPVIVKQRCGATFNAVRGVRSSERVLARLENFSSCLASTFAPYRQKGADFRHFRKKARSCGHAALGAALKNRRHPIRGTITEFQDTEKKGKGDIIGKQLGQKHSIYPGGFLKLTTRLAFSKPAQLGSTASRRISPTCSGSQPLTETGTSRLLRHHRDKPITICQPGQLIL